MDDYGCILDGSEILENSLWKNSCSLLQIIVEAEKADYLLLSF